LEHANQLKVSVRVSVNSGFNISKKTVIVKQKVNKKQTKSKKKIMPQLLVEKTGRSLELVENE